jgi:GAF domain-containing protein
VDAATAPGRADLSDLVAAFRKVAEAISEDGELDAILHIVGRECCALLDVRRCSVYLKDEDADVYRGRVGEPDPAWDESISG